MGGQRQEGHDAVDTTVAGIADARWGVRPQPAIKRFTEPGWFYEEVAPRPCSQCGGPLHTLRKPYENGGKQYRYVALVCPTCPATFTLSDLGVKTYEQLPKPPSANRTAAATAYPAPSPTAAADSTVTRRSAEISSPSSTSPRRWLDCDVAPGGVRVRTIPADHVPEFLAELLGQPGTRVISGNLPPQPATVVEQRLLHWCKITDPDAPAPAQPAGVDVRVLLPLAEEFAGLCARLTLLECRFGRFGTGGRPRRSAPWVRRAIWCRCG